MILKYLLRLNEILTNALFFMEMLLSLTQNFQNEKKHY